MTEPLDYRILNLLKESSEPLSSDKLSFDCSKSSKTIRNRIKELEPILINNGAKIEIKKGSGYLLKIKDERLFNLFMETLCSDENESQSNDSLFFEVVYLLISQSDYIKADDIIEMLYISKSKLTQVFNQLRISLQHYDLVLEAKPYYGIKIVGEEFNLRRFISSIYAQNYSLAGTSFLERSQENEKLANMRKQVTLIVSKAMENYAYPMPTHIFNSFASHLIITLLRIEKNMAVNMSSEMIVKDMSEKEINIVKDVTRELEKQFNVSLPQSEQDYMLLHLISKRVLEVSDKHHIPMEVSVLINTMLERVKDSKNIDLREDLDLRIMLGLHLVPLISRIQYGIELKNPILDEVKWRCIAAYDLAITCCKVLEEKYHVLLSEHEISYFALHLDVALNKKADLIKKKRVLIVCSSGRASARLLETKFEQLFSNYLEHIDVCDVNEVMTWTSENEYDFIFTTVPLECKLPQPIFEFSFFLNNRSIRRIQSVLMGTAEQEKITKYFKEEFFFGNVEADSRESVLEYMFKRIRAIRELPANFETLVYEREAYCGTDLLPNTALPHPNRTITDDTFISVCTLKKPVLWNKNKVRLVVLISISRNDSEMYKFLFEMLLSLLSNSTSVQRILNEGSYEVLKQELILLDYNEKE